MFLSCAVSEILSLIAKNVKRSRNSFGGNYNNITYALVHLCSLYQSAYEVSSFTDSKDMIRANFFKKRDVTLTTPIGGSLSSQDQHLIYSTCIQTLATLATAVPEI